MSPFFSIVIPTYNRSRLIVDTLSSLLNQSFLDFEIIVIDDGSTDNTEEIIRATFGDNVRYYFQENAERGAARNHGFRLSLGQYVLFFDSDDFMHPNHLRVLMDEIKKENFPDFIATKHNFKRNGSLVAHAIDKVPSQYLDYRFFLKGNPLACHFCVKKDIPDLKYFIENREYAIMEDWLFLLDNLQKRKLFLVDQVTITMNDHEERSMRANTLLVSERRLLAQEWIDNHLNLPDNDKKECQASTFYFCAIHHYITGNKKNVFDFLKKASSLNGLRFSYLVLFFKTVIGYPLISRIKN